VNPRHGRAERILRTPVPCASGCRKRRARDSAVPSRRQSTSSRAPGTGRFFKKCTPFLKKREMPAAAATPGAPLACSPETRWHRACEKNSVRTCGREDTGHDGRGSSAFSSANGGMRWQR